MSKSSPLDKLNLKEVNFGLFEGSWDLAYMFIQKKKKSMFILLSHTITITECDTYTEEH